MGSALASGVVLKSVDTFAWTREGVPSQSALDGPNTDAADGLSVVTIQDDQLQIMITSVIYAAFYVTDGTVAASGTASMEFASSSASRRRRRLPENEKENDSNNNKRHRHRHLQDINDSSLVELNVPVLKGSGVSSGYGVGISVTTVAIIVGLMSGALLLLP